jgi:translation initiation factor 4B
MRPDLPAAKSPVPSRDGSEAPSSPAIAAAAPASRPKLNLAKRTVSEAPEVLSPASVTGDVKASPFGAARPIDTAAKEKEIEEKRLAAIKEKKDAEEKVKEERKEAARAAKAVEAEKQESVERDGKVETGEKADDDEASNEQTAESENINGEVVDDKSVKLKETIRDAKPKPAETGAWRRPSGGPPPPRDDVPRGPRGGRGGRGSGRGPRNYDEGRGGRQNTNGGNRSPATPIQNSGPDSETATIEEDGWSTVSKPKKNNRGGNQGARAIAS